MWQQERHAERERSGGWTVTDHLLAVNAELTHLVYRGVLSTVPRQWGWKMPAPYVIARPGESTKSKAVAPAALFAAMRG